MASHPNRGRMKRPIECLHAISRLYPDAWQKIDVFRKDRGKDLPTWPEWCFLPMAAWYSIVSEKHNVDRLDLTLVNDVSKLAALGAWRYTQSIYRFDEELFKAVTETVPKGDLPVDVLLRMPEWSLYIETPDTKWHNSKMHGFWAHLEYDVNRHANELRLLIDTDDEFVPVPIHMGKWTVTEAIDRALSESKKQAQQAGLLSAMENISENFIERQAESLYPLVSLVLYVCCDSVEYSDGISIPNNPLPKRTKKGWKLFPAQKSRIWNLGEKTGDLIRASRENKESSSDRKSPAPHIRRAHWHSFWTGKDEEKKIIVKFIPPLPIAMKVEESHKDSQKK